MSELKEEESHKPDDVNLSPSKSMEDLQQSPGSKSWIKFEEESANNAIATIEPSQSTHLDKAALQQESPSRPEAVVDAKRNSVLYEKRSSTPDAPAKIIPPPKAPPRKPTPPPVSNVTTNGHHPVSQIDQIARPTLQSVSLNDAVVSPPPQPPHVHRPTSRGSSRHAGLNNGDVIVTLLPVNVRCAWISKAEFRPELVPEELMAEGLTLTVEDYVSAMQILVNDVRYNIYIVCYKRLLLVWIMLGFLVLLTLLFSGVRGLALFGGGIVWLVINAAGIFVCMWLKTKMNRMLEHCFANVNSMFTKHRVVVGLDDRGKISCHKVNLIFIFFDTGYCLKYLKDMLENEERQLSRNVASQATGETTNNRSQPKIDRSRMDISTTDIIITGTQARISHKEKSAERLLLRYSQRWVKEYVRKRLDLNLPLHPDGTEEPGPPATPRHCTRARCLCQFIEEHLRFKPQSKCTMRDFCV